MVRIGNVWDSTTEVLGGRTAMLAGLALLAFFVPAALQAVVSASGDKSSGMAVLSAAVTLLALVASVWGGLAIVAVASDPATTRAQATAAATARLPAALLLMLVLIAVGILIALPAIGVLLASGFDFQAAFAQAGSATNAKLPAGASLFLFFYGIAIFVASLWFYARMFPLMAVVLRERRRIGAFGRSLQLTRGMTWRLVGVAILFAVVYVVAALAAQSIVFIVARLLLGPALITVATVIGGLAAAAVGAVFSTIVAVFGARLYAALSDREAAAP